VKKQKSKASITVRLVQKSDGTWKIKKGPHSKKAENILKGSMNLPAAQSRPTKPTSDENFLPAVIETYPVEDSDARPAFPTSYRKTVEMKQEAIWSSLAKIKLRDAMEQWFESILNSRTKKSYKLAMRELISRDFLDPQWSLQQFSLISPDRIIDNIKTMPVFVRDREGKETGKQWSMRTREARIASFLAFTRYLSRKTEGMIRRGVPSRDGIEKTFSSPSRKVKSEAMSRSQIVCFLEELDQINPRDGMIARLCLHGGKRINEVLSLRVDQIDFEKKQITFYQSKSKFADDFTVISFERPAAEALLDELGRYIGERRELVFVTANGKGLRQNQVDRNFMKAGRRAGIPFRVSPHNLRATAVTLWKEDGFSDSLIMKATGHSSSEMVHRYDKTDIAENVTRKSCVI
jgi:integrase/recombinase XerD